jgi:hypothetical protein
VLIYLVAQPGVGFVLQGWTQVTNAVTNGGPFEDPIAQCKLLLYWERLDRALSECDR